MKGKIGIMEKERKLLFSYILLVKNIAIFLLLHYFSEQKEMRMQNEIF